MPFDPFLYAVPVAAMVVGVALFVFAPKILSTTGTKHDTALQVLIVRIVIVIFIVLQIADIAIHRVIAAYYNRLLLRVSLSMLAIIVAFVIFNVATRTFNRRFGTTRTFDGKTVSVPSYHSRMAGMVLLAVLLILVGYAMIEIWGMDSLTQKTGFIGVIAAFLVLTSTVWLPDIFYGLVLLGSSMAEEGDTIAIPGEDRLYVINGLTPFYTLLLDVDNNHRTMMRNSKLMSERIENLSKRASVEGLRRQVEFKLGYPKPGEDHAGAGSLFHRVGTAVAEVFEQAVKDPAVKVNANIPFEWSLVEAGDNALRFVLHYHLSALPVTKHTSKVRSHLRTSHNAITRMVFERAAAHGLDLATPALLKIDAATGWPSATKAAGSGAAQDVIPNRPVG